MTNETKKYYISLFKILILSKQCKGFRDKDNWIIQDDIIEFINDMNNHPISKWTSDFIEKEIFKYNTTWLTAGVEDLWNFDDVNDTEEYDSSARKFVIESKSHYWENVQEYHLINLLDRMLEVIIPKVNEYYLQAKNEVEQVLSKIKIIATQYKSEDLEILAKTIHTKCINELNSLYNDGNWIKDTQNYDTNIINWDNTYNIYYPIYSYLKSNGII